MRVRELSSPVGEKNIGFLWRPPFLCKIFLMEELQVQSQSNFLQLLPVEVLLYTLSFLNEKYLCTLAKTSKWLRKHAYDPSLPSWKGIDFSRYRSKVSWNNSLSQT